MTRPPRVLYFSSLFPTPVEPHRGIFALRRAQALISAGVELQAVCPLGMTPPARLALRPRAAGGWMRERLEAPGETELEGVPVVYPRWVWPPKALVGGLDGRLLYTQVARRLDRLIDDFRPGAIVASWLPDAAAACLFGRRHGLPVIALAEGSDVLYLPRTYRWWSRMQAALNTAAAFVFVSDDLRTHAPAAGLRGPKEFVVHNGFDETLFVRPSHSERSDEAVVLTVGSHTEVKDHESLLRAVALIRGRLHRPLRLMLVGDGPLKPRLVKLAEELGFNGSVAFLGTRTQAALVPLYQSADVFCLPSRSEGMGCVLLEAMGCGTPVVASRVGGIPELVCERTGILVSPGRPEELAVALEAALAREWQPGEISARAAASFTWSRAGARLLDVVEEVVNAA